MSERPERFAARRPAPDPGVRWEWDLRRAPFVSWDPERLRAGRFEFLNRTAEVGWPPRWDDVTPSRLWLYNLHYFEYLWSLPYDLGRELVLDWIARHPLA